MPIKGNAINSIRKLRNEVYDTDRDDRKMFGNTLQLFMIAQTKAHVNYIHTNVKSKYKGNIE